MTENASLESWDSFTSHSFLKAADVPNEQTPYVCIGADSVKDKTSEKLKIQLTLEQAGKNFKFDLNATNTRTLKQNVASPKAAIGKKIFFRKVMAMSPKTKTEVESLRIAKVE